MRRTKNELPEQEFPPVTFDGGGKTFKISLQEFPDFFDKCIEMNLFEDIEDLEIQLQNISDEIVNCADETQLAGHLKKQLQLMREIQFMFKSVFWEVKV